MKTKDKKIRLWRIYLANIPYWDKWSKSFLHKLRPVLIYNFSGDDAIVLPLTSNENPDGSMDKKPHKTEVSIKTNKYGIVKVTKPLTINKEAILVNKLGMPIPDKQRKQIKFIFKKFVILPETKEKI